MEKMKKILKNKKGFTLIELIVVLVILAILMALLVPSLTGYITRARRTTDMANARSALTAYQAAANLEWTADSPNFDSTYIGREAQKLDASIDPDAITATIEAATGEITKFEYVGSSYTVIWENDAWTTDPTE